MASTASSTGSGSSSGVCSTSSSAVPRKVPSSSADGGGGGGRVYFSYADVHATIDGGLIPQILEAAPDFAPSIMIAIGGGGYIPARILRTTLKIPVLAVGLELYDDATNDFDEESSDVRCLQWFDDTKYPGNLVTNGDVLIVDEVDDTRTTLQYCVEQVLKKHKPRRLAVAVVHNKIKPKRGVLPEGVLYFAGADVPGDCWNCYPWDAAAYGLGIDDHEKLARSCTVPPAPAAATTDAAAAAAETEQPATGAATPIEQESDH